MVEFLSIIAVLEFGVTVTGPLSLFTLVMQVLFVIGLTGIFRKAGVHPLWALVPCYRLFVLAECADREAEGKVLFLVELIYETLDLILLAVDIASFDKS